MMLRFAPAALAAAMALVPISAMGQSSPNFSYGQVPTAGQWNAAFASKQDRLTYTPLNQAGGTMLGRLAVAPSTVNGSGLTILPGATPQSPGNGDLWATSVGLFARIANVTIQLADLATVQATVASETNRAQAVEATKAPIASPTFTGTATTPLLAITGSGSTGDGSLFTALPSGASTPRNIAARALDMGRNVRDFGAVCDGATDSGPAFRAAFASGARVVRYDLENCPSHYLINTTVTIPGGASLVGPDDGMSAPLGIRTTANVDTFALGGNQFEIRDVYILHDGTSGSAVNAGSAQSGKILKNAFTGSSASNTSPLIYITGSIVTVAGNHFTNFRSNGYAISINGPGTTNPIVHRIADNNFGGSGKGISIGSTSGTTRPEGIYLVANHCFLTNVCLLVNSVNDLRSIGNTYDIGTVNQVVLAASGQGIDLASFTDDYFSTLNTSVTPAVTRTGGVCLQVSGPVARLTVRSKFAYCDYGVTSTDGNASYMTIGSSFLNVTNTALNIQGVKGATIAGNTCASCANNFILADGASGGPFVLNENQWDPAGTTSITQTTPSKFRFGAGNTGINLAGYSAATTPSMATGNTCLGVAIPHGLSGTPNLDKTTLSGRAVSGSITNISVAASTSDATNIVALVCGTVATAGTVRVTVNASL